MGKRIRGTGIAGITRFIASLLLAAVGASVTAAPQPILIGLDADMSSASAQAGEAIRRGAAVAIHEINNSGGVLGRPLQLLVKDHRGNPTRGWDNVLQLSKKPELVAVLGGLHSSVGLKEIPLIHEKQLIYLGPWAAATALTSNGHSPNYVFRVSVRDEYAGDFLVDSAKQRGFKRLGLLLERSGWGRSNDKAIDRAAEKHGLEIVNVQWFNWGIRNLQPQIDRLQEAGADVIMLVANPREGVALVKALAEMPTARRLPVISHWGISGGRFVEQAGTALGKVDLQFLQTYSFHQPRFPERQQSFLSSYELLFPGQSQPHDIRSPVGTAQAYDLVHMLAHAIRDAGSTDRPRIRDALERLENHHGLIRDYKPPFTAERHDALDASDFRMATFDHNGHIVPVGKNSD